MNALYKDGTPIWEIALSFRRSEKTVSKVLRAFGHDTRRRKRMSQEEYDRIVKRLKQGDLPAVIAEDVGRSERLVCSIRREIERDEYRDYSARKRQAVVVMPLSCATMQEWLFKWKPPRGLKEHLAELS